ncbi:MAG TPA: hypothetical protein PK659_09090 [Methanothrix sp.]|nr:hypothetical protein [Methanothrix sp.]HOL44392.1 hypothetical protein [Methanothrix sp.]
MRVILRPRSFLDKLKAYLFERYPTYDCTRLAFGPAMIEASNDDECLMVPYTEVLCIFWDSGYSAVLNRYEQILEKMAGSGEQGAEAGGIAGAGGSGGSAPAKKADMRMYG